MGFCPCSVLCLLWCGSVCFHLSLFHSLPLSGVLGGWGPYFLSLCTQERTPYGSAGRLPGRGGRVGVSDRAAAAAAAATAASSAADEPAQCQHATGASGPGQPGCTDGVQIAADDKVALLDAVDVMACSGALPFSHVWRLLPAPWPASQPLKGRVSSIVDGPVGARGWSGPPWPQYVATAAATVVAATTPATAGAVSCRAPQPPQPPPLLLPRCCCTGGGCPGCRCQKCACGRCPPAAGASLCRFAGVSPVARQFIGSSVHGCVVACRFHNCLIIILHENKHYP